MSAAKYFSYVEASCLRHSNSAADLHLNLLFGSVLDLKKGKAIKIIYEEKKAE